MSLAAKVASAYRHGGVSEVMERLLRRVRPDLHDLYGILPPLYYEELRAHRRLGYWPHVRHPRSFNEKVLHRMLFKQHPLSHIVADKWGVRQYVKSKDLETLLIDTYFVGDEPDRIPFDDLPDKYVIKANHGCHWNMLIRDGRSVNRVEVVEQCRKWLGQRLTATARCYEKHYDLIPPKILVERFIEDSRSGIPPEYKFFCFHGKVRYVKVIDRSGSPTLTFYDTEWRVMDFSYNYPNFSKGNPIQRPARLDRMIEVAEVLGGDFDFARIDLYSPSDDNVIFGEITLTPCGGVGRFEPREWDFRLGQLW